MNYNDYLAELFHSSYVLTKATTLPSFSFTCGNVPVVYIKHWNIIVKMPGTFGIKKINITHLIIIVFIIIRQLGIVKNALYWALNEFD